MSGVTDTYRDDKRVLTATFDTQGGANLAVKKLQELGKEDLWTSRTRSPSTRMPWTSWMCTRRPATAAAKEPKSAPWWAP